MKKTHRWLSAFVSVALAFAVAGCQIDSDRHEHSFSKDWTSNATDHWHAATCEHTKEVSGKAKHTFGDWTVTKEATEEAEGSRERSCTVCGYTATEAIEKLAHTHTFAEEWSSDKTNHWHAATCGHTTEVSDKTEHTFSDWNVTKEASCTEKGEKKATCTTCGYEETEITDKAEHTYTNGVCNCGLPEGFVLIPAGTFQMGSNVGYSDNKPVHEVTITKPFYMGKYEVTQAEYEKYCSYGSSSPSSDKGDGDNYPAYYVSWYDALVYCNKRSMAEGLTPCYSISGSTDPEKWGTVPTSSNNTWNAVVCNWNANGYRLPTEAEWEYAARAEDNTVASLTYSGTSDVNKLGEYAWYSSNSNSKTHEVGTKKANGFGLYDMSGNVCELCWNWVTDSYDAKTEGGSNPTGTSSGSRRVFRGGNWSDGSDYCAVYLRNGYYLYPYNRGSIFGFRVVRASSK
ncbi:MAG: formylglycine-generating enzyme family protein [Spirochaetia bacterium]|nr:formylglycine-generating enzyme family protein [Spirochaetia bacterium]